MFGTGSEHYQVVKDSLAGERDIDEQTFASLAILKERINRLKKVDKIFSNVTLSPFVQQLTRHQKEAAIG